jgi:hypothetical protein
MSTGDSLEALTAEDFRRLRDSRFRLTGGAHQGGSVTSFDAELAEVTEYPASALGSFRAPFSVLFRGPIEPVMPQGIYRLEHEQLGTHEFFIVPLGPDEPSAPGQSPAAMRYEAVFG